MSEPQVFAKQLPTLVTAYFHYDKVKFKSRAVAALDPEHVTDQFLTEIDLYYDETSRIINTFEAIMCYQYSALKRQVKLRLMH